MKQETRLSILLIDESGGRLALYQSALAENGAVHLYSVQNLQEAAQWLTRARCHLIILDVPQEQTALMLFTHLQKIASDRPIITVMAHYEKATALQMITLGAEECLGYDQITSPHFSRHLNHSLKRHEVLLSTQTLSFTDQLTGVYNRRGFMELAEQQIEISKRLKSGFFLFLADVDYLKEINDQHGHLEGDKALRDTANILKRSFRNTDIVGRIGGDEFAILATFAAPDDEDIMMENVQNTIIDYTLAQRHPYHLSLSLGGAYLDYTDDLTIDELMEQADSALYINKQAHHRE